MSDSSGTDSETSTMKTEQQFNWTANGQSMYCVVSDQENAWGTKRGYRKPLLIGGGILVFALAVFLSEYQIEFGAPEKTAKTAKTEKPATPATKPVEAPGAVDHPTAEPRPVTPEPEPAVEGLRRADD